MAQLAADGCHSVVREVEPGLTGIACEPDVGVGQRALLVATDAGNVLWDPAPFADDAAFEAVRAAGGLSAVASSHPHMYGAAVEWSHAFDAEILLPSVDDGWLMRPDPAVRTWADALEVLPGVTLVQCGGHFPGSSVLHWAAGAEGRGVILCGDTIFVTPGEDRVSFVYSAPVRLPLAEPGVRGIVRRSLPMTSRASTVAGGARLCAPTARRSWSAPRSATSSCCRPSPRPHPASKLARRTNASAHRRWAVKTGYSEGDYDIRLDNKFGYQTLIDVDAEAAAHEPWFNQTLTSVNDSVVRLGVIEGDFHWHKHDDTDEFFMVLDGELVIDLEDRPSVRLTRHQSYTVPRTVMHRTSAPVRTAILMVEAAGVAPTGDDGLSLDRLEQPVGCPQRLCHRVVARGAIALASLADDVLRHRGDPALRARGALVQAAAARGVPEHAAVGSPVLAAPHQ